MKQYLVVDLFSDSRWLMNYNDLKDLLIEQLEQDTRENHEDYDIVNNNLKVLTKLAREKENLNYLTEQLLSFSFKTIDLLELQRDLFDTKDYFDYVKKEKVETFNDVIERINKEVNK